MAFTSWVSSSSDGCDGRADAGLDAGSDGGLDTGVGIVSGLPNGVTIADEATFRAAWHCPAGETSGIDFATYRLRISTVIQAGGPVHVTSANRLDGTVHLHLSDAHYCSASFAPTATLYTLLPQGSEEVVEEECETVCAWAEPP